MKLQQSLQNALDEWARITDLDLCLLDAQNNLFVTTRPFPLPDPARLEEFKELDAECMGNADTCVYKVLYGNQLRYLLILHGKNPDLPTLSQLALCQVSSLLEAHAPKEDKLTFLRELLLGDCPQSEVASRARQLKISTDARRLIFYIQMKTAQDETALTMIRNLFSTRTKDFILPIGDSAIVVIREILPTDDMDEMDAVARMLIDMLGSEAMISAWVSYSNVTPTLQGLTRAYQEARMAIEVGRIFASQKNIFPYNRLGIGRLIYQLPQEVCEMFVDEVFGARDLSDLDDVMLATIRLLFENNLNLSETSRQLFVHRNTLVYRFEKLQKRYGLDLRTFEDAVTFKIGMMVVEYLKQKSGL